MNVDEAMAYQRMEDRFREMVQDLCDTAKSVEEANRFYQAGVQMFHLQMTAKIRAPAFQERIARERVEEAARLLRINEAALRAQLAEHGIDPEPIFADGGPGGSRTR